MIKHKLLTLLVALCATTALWAETVTSTFTDNNWNVGNGEETWIANGASAYGFETSGAARGVQVRLVDIHNNGLTLTNTSIKDLGVINKIEIVYSSNCADSSAGTISVTVGSITLGETYTIKKENNATISFESETPVGGDIVITFTSTATSKSMYVKSISVTYSDFPENYTITYTAAEKLTGYTLDVGVTTFGPAIISHSFSNGTGTITCSEEITTIGEYAFYGCSGLTSVTIPNSVTTIGEYAFYGCSGLTSVTIPNSVTSIGYEAFYGCSGLTSVTIGNSVTTIGNEAFEDCSGLTSVTIGNSVTTIGNNAFYGCSSLTSVTIPNSVTTIGEGAFYGCSGLTSVTIPNSVTSIGGRAFEGCSGLTSVTIPNSVTTIGERAFWDCSGLTSVTLNSDAICSKTYYDDNIGSFFGSQVKEYIIGNSVTTIGESAFEGCSGLTSVTIPNSVTTIGFAAFYKCSGLTSVTIPNSVTEIGNAVFTSCYSLTSIDVDAANTHYVSIDGVLFNYAKNTLIKYPVGNSRTEYTIPNSVKTIGDYAFEGCSSLTSITIPYSVTTIESWAFYGCYGLTSVTIGNSVTWIGEYAFYNCFDLTSVTCEATEPPLCWGVCFSNVTKRYPLYIPKDTWTAYIYANEWKNFTNMRPITAKDVEVTEIEADPTESAVEIAWPSVVNAETYTIEIRLGDQLICSIVFNAQGQLVSINFNLAPGRGGHTYATTAESTATGWAYTIAGLNPGTNYTYSVIAKNADGQVIDTKSGVFSTRNTPTDIDNMGNNFNNSYVNPTKSLRNGQVLIRKDGKTYNTLGQEL